MFSELILIHRNGGQASQAPVGGATSLLGPDADALRAFYFKTCLRQLAIVDAETAASIEIQPTDDVHRGGEAYRFLLEVICGLRSPLVGETEVSGQFKLAVAAYPIPATPWGQQLKRFFQNLFEDAKRVRQNHLVDLGSQSYGSVLRREFKRLPQVKTIHILGAGHLVQEVLPWIAKDGIKIHVHCRNPEKARSAFAGRTDYEIHSLKETVAFGPDDAFVVAAPVTAEWLQTWMSSHANHAPEIIADLRADSAEDRIALNCRVLDLSQVFSHISETQSHLDACKAAALKAIEAAVQERHRYVEYRPFGWEDVCA